MTLDERAAAELFRAEDPELTPAEKETVLRFSRDDARVEVYTAERGVGRRLLCHPFAEIHAVTVADGEARRDRAVEDLDGDEEVVGVRASVPVGLLLVKSTPRRDEGHAEIITDRVLDEDSTIHQGGGRA